MCAKCLLNPDLRVNGQPELGRYAPTETRFFCKIHIATSSLDSQIGVGLFAKEDIGKGTVVCIGGGQVTTCINNAPPEKDFAGIFDNGYYIAPLNYDSPTPNWYINHSCDSNLKIVGRFVIIARRDIVSNEELTANYSTIAAGEESFKMSCKCRNANCRNIITGNDWRNCQLFREHYEEWPPFIQAIGKKLHDRI